MTDHAQDCPCFIPPGRFVACAGHIIAADGRCGDCGRECTCRVRVERLAAFQAPADTRGGYTLTSTWAPSAAFPSGDTLMQSFASLDEAINTGLHLSCCAGVRSVLVTDGDTVHCEYDRQDNLWNSRTPEAQRFARTGSTSDDDLPERWGVRTAMNFRGDVLAAIDALREGTK